MDNRLLTLNGLAASLINLMSYQIRLKGYNINMMVLKGVCW
jgi:hypothetical protein